MAVAAGAIIGAGLQIYADQAAGSAQDQAEAAQLHLFKRRHQFEVQDLIKAGLNPILSAHSAPGVSAPPAVKPDIVAGKGITAALQLANMKAAVSSARSGAVTAGHLAVKTAAEAGTAREVQAAAMFNNQKLAQQAGYWATEPGKKAIADSAKLDLELGPWKGVDWQKALMSAGSGLDMSGLQKLGERLGLIRKIPQGGINE